MKKVLIVDDVESWRQFNKKAVEEVLKEGVEISLASSAREAYNLLLDNYSSPFDLIITDLQIESEYEPLSAGEWLIEQIQNLKKYVNTQVIIVSSMSNIKFIADKYNVDMIRKTTLTDSVSALHELIILK